MKKYILTLMAGCVVWGGVGVAQTNPVSHPTNLMPSVGLPILPLTNQSVFTNALGFTNTVVQVTNLSRIQLSNVLSQLLNLQTNIEETLPVLVDITSNATFAIPAGAQQTPGIVAPLTMGTTGTLAPNSLQGNVAQARTITIGTEVFEIDPPTFQALVTVRDNLEQTLPVLQALNGTTPSETNPPVASATFTTQFAPLTNFPPPVSGTFMGPLTNQSHLITNPSPF